MVHENGGQIQRNESKLEPAAVRWCLGLPVDSVVSNNHVAEVERRLTTASIAGGRVRVVPALAFGQPAHVASRGGWLVVEGHPIAAGLRVGVVGTRQIPAREQGRIERHVAEIVADPRVTLVSGGARGADAIAHDLAASQSRPAVIVPAGGLANAGPIGHRAAWRVIVEHGGSIVTMRPPLEAPIRGSWLLRNRLIAALSDVLCVVAAPVKSGALNTVRHARRLGRPVLVMPWSVGEPWAAGSNRLLDSADIHVWQDASSVWSRLHGCPGSSTDEQDNSIGLTPDGRALFDALRAAPLLGMEGAADRLGWSISRLLQARLDIDIAGVTPAGSHR